MLWMGNVPATFQTELNPTYKPMDRFQNGLEGKWQGEQVDLRKVFPKKFHLEFHGNLIYQHVCVSLSLILVLTYFSFKRAWTLKDQIHPPEFAHILVLESLATTPNCLHKPVGSLTTAGNLFGGCNLPIRTLFTIHLPQSFTGIIKAIKISRLYSWIRPCLM